MTQTEHLTAFDALARLARRSPREMREVLVSDAPEQGQFQTLPPQPGMTHCARLDALSAGVDFEATLCAALIEAGIKFTLRFRIFGATLVNTNGVLTPEEPEWRVHGDRDAVSGILTVGVNHWATHAAPFIRWRGELQAGSQRKPLRVDHQFFCLR